ncbi:MAG: 30S ribosomal protein S6 [Pseudoflavonifractor sp.]|nr:30S ribosomal protein S6 [Pseudoflavonifractor sp.]
MAKLNANYEALYIIDSRKNEEETAALVEKFKTLAESNSKQCEVDEWGKRHLAYPIQDQNEGYYVLMTFVSEPAFPAELDRIFRITDGVIRSIIVCKDEK